MSKYCKLWDYIKNTHTQTLLLSFEQIADISGEPLDHSFLNSKKELEAYGFCVKKISLKNKTVLFEQIPE